MNEFEQNETKRHEQQTENISVEPNEENTNDLPADNGTEKTSGDITGHIIEGISFFLYPVLLVAIFHPIRDIVWSLIHGSFPVSELSGQMLFAAGLLLIIIFWWKCFCSYPAALKAAGNLVYHVSRKPIKTKPAPAAIGIIITLAIVALFCAGHLRYPSHGKHSVPQTQSFRDGMGGRGFDREHGFDGNDAFDNKADRNENFNRDNGDNKDHDFDRGHRHGSKSFDGGQTDKDRRYMPNGTAAPSSSAAPQ